jgi:integrase/recombinase XerD
MPEHEYINQFLNTIEAQKGFSSNTLSAYKNDLGQFASYLESGPGAGTQPAEQWPDVTRDHIMAFVLHLQERGYSKTTVARKLAAIKSFFKYLVAEHIVERSPAEEMASPHVDRTVPHTVSAHDMEALMSRISAAGTNPEGLRDRAMLQLLVASGLRAGEMVALNTEDVNLQDGTVRVVDGRGKDRDISINSPLVLEALGEYLEKGRPALARSEQGANLAGESEGRALFLNHRGQRLTRQGFWLILKEYARAAGLGEITPHTLRHSFAAQKLEGGADIRDLQRILGHANVSTTQIYARMGEGGKRKSRRRSRGQADRGDRKAG